MKYKPNNPKNSIRLVQKSTSRSPQHQQKEGIKVFHKK